MPVNLQPSVQVITVQNEFMKTTQGMVFKVAGATFDSQGIGARVIKAGTAIAVREDGFAHIWKDEIDVAEGNAGYLLTNDIVVDGTDAKYLVGLLMGGYPDEAKCHEITAAFKEAVKERIHFI